MLCVYTRLEPRAGRRPSAWPPRCCCSPRSRWRRPPWTARPGAPSSGPPGSASPTARGAARRSPPSGTLLASRPCFDVFLLPDAGAASIDRSEDTSLSTNMAIISVCVCRRPSVCYIYGIWLPSFRRLPSDPFFLSFDESPMIHATMPMRGYPPIHTWYVMY